MSNVTLTIGGRQYRVACADGQEDHIVRLGAAIDEKLSTMGDAGPNEARALLFAALLLADEIYELKQQPTATPPQPDLGPDPAPALEALAARLEKLAASLEGQRASA